MVRIYIDRSTGVYGSVDDLRIVEVPGNPDDDEVGEWLDGKPDSFLTSLADSGEGVYTFVQQALEAWENRPVIEQASEELEKPA